MKNVFLANRAKKSVFEKVTSGLLVLSMNLVAGGATIFSAFIPVTASAATTVFTDGFESGNFSSWTVADNDWHVTSGSGHSGNRKAQVYDQGPSADVLQKDISTVGYTGLSLTYYIKAGQALESNDHVYVEWWNGSSWTLLSDISNLAAGGWSSVITHNLSAAANNLSSFKFRFRAVGLEDNTGGGDKDEFQVDDISLIAAGVTENTLARCTDGIDNDLDSLVDISDPDCAPFYNTLTVLKAGSGTGNVSGTGISCGADCTEQYVNNTVVNLSATADTNSTFMGWSGACSGVGSCAVTMDTAKSVTATFDLKSYTLTTGTIGNGNISATGISCGMGAVDCSEDYVHGTSVTLTQSAETGWTFNGWGGACTGTGSCVVTMDSAKTVTATFTQDPIEEPTFATITATKIVCDNETDLPNWSGAEMTILPSTITNFLESHPNCSLAEGWKFQWADQSGMNPGDSLVGEVGLPWQTTGATNAQGVTSWNVPLAGVTEVRVREVLQNGYMPFTHNGGESESSVSAELWCHEDVLHYDNYDFVHNPESGGNYYCVAINVPTATDVCPNLDGMQTVVPDGYVLADGQCILDDEVVDVCPNVQGTQTTVPEGMELVEGNCVEIVTPTDVCPNLDGMQTVVPEGYVLAEGQCVLDSEVVDVCPNLDGAQSVIPSGYEKVGDSQNCTLIQNTNGGGGVGGGGGGSIPPQCADGSDNDGDGKADYPNDLGCENSSDNDESGSGSPAPTASGEAAGTPGEVLGATTEELPLPPGCSPYLLEYLKLGRKGNTADEVKKLQTFLNEEMNANLPVTGYFGPLTHNWVKKFQVKYHIDILKPWKDAGYIGRDLENGTGLVYKTTKRWINIMKCESLKSEPMPLLTPFVEGKN